MNAINEVTVAGETLPYIISDGVDDSIGRKALDKVGRELARWVESGRAATQRPSLFDRSAYAAPDNPYAQMLAARRAVENEDIVAGVADVTEALAFQGVKWESPNPDDADIFNQIARDLNLDQVVRTWHREEYTYSQVVVGMYWGRKTYKVRGYNLQHTPPEKKTDPLTGEPYFAPTMDETTGEPVKPKKIKRKKSYDIVVPRAITFLDPMRVVPLGADVFGRDNLAWQASKAEMTAWDAHDNGTIFDPVMGQFFKGKVTNLTRREKDDLGKLGIDHTRLLYMDERNVFRVTRTKASYQRWADIRLKSVFPLLDLKQQLMEADRAALVGAANYILLVKKGTDADPAEQSEIDNLNENFKIVAKIPVIVSDHRLEIEIITPDQDYVLNGDKYDTLDRRILNRTIGALSVSSAGQRNESTLTVSRGIARILESRRLMMKRAMEQYIARQICEINKDTFEDEPNLAFTPRNVQLDNDTQTVNAVMALRTQNELSRESILEFFGFDQEVEAQRREFEDESGLDDIFETAVPFDSPANALNGGKVAPSVSGAQGGRPIGGGSTAQSPKKAVAPKTPKGNPSTGSK